MKMSLFQSFQSSQYLSSLPIELRESLCNYLAFDSGTLSTLFENITQFQSLQRNDKLWIEIYHRNLSEVIRPSHPDNKTSHYQTIYLLYITKLRLIEEGVLKNSNTSLVQYLPNFFLNTSNVNDKLLRFL